MSSRNAHMNTSESRYPPRDRSPSRFLEKRSTIPHSAGPLAARITDPSLRQNHNGPLAARVSDPHRSTYTPTGRVTDPPHRQNDIHAYSSANREPQREPPRGPKALLEGQRATGYGARGRGFAGRVDARDREFRELRDVSAPRRGMERDWGRRGRMDSRDSRTSLTGRTRSRSPVPRDFREVRESIPRDTDNSRARRDSRDGPLSASSSVSEIPSATNFNNPSSFRERGRVDSDYAKVRGSHPEERDGRNRSRSSERPWEKKSRDEREPQNLEYNRRDDDTRRDRDEREREAERYRRDLPGFRPDSRNSNRTQFTPSTPVSTSALSLYQANAERTVQGVHEQNAEPSRKLSVHIATANSAIGNRDNERNDTLFRVERDRQVQPTASPPPQAPQVPAFGSIAYRAPPAGQVAIDSKDRFKHETPQVSHSRSTSFDVTKELPSGPKDIFIGNAPTGPKLGQPLERPSIDTIGLARSVFEFERERDRSALLPTLTTMDLNDAEARRGQQHSGHNLSSQLPIVQEALPSRVAEIYSEPHAVQRQRCLQLLQPYSRKDTEETSRNLSTGINLVLGTSIKPNYHEATSQHSPVKIPTGPRADRTASAQRQPVSPPVRAPPTRPATTQRPPRQANLKWVRPGLSQHTPRGPSIMNTVPTKRDYAGEEKQRVIQVEREPIKSIELFWSRDNAHSKEPAAPSSIGRSQIEHRIGDDNIKIEDSPSEPKETSRASEQKDGRFSPSQMRKSTESNDMDVGYILDDDDFAEDERKFELKLEALNARQPPTPRHHPALLDLLNECDALASAAEDLTKATNGPFIESLPLGLPSPKPEETDTTSLKDLFMISALTPTARRKTPPIENLPFLISGPPTPFSETDNRQQNSFHHELVRARILDMLGNQRERVEADNEDLRVEFAKRYRDWRMQIEDYEDLKKAEHSITPAPDPPQPTALPLVNSAPIMEGRRSGKNVSELDLLRVLRESALTHQEEQERRGRETKIPVNLEKEATIPRMLNRYELESHTFIDTNHLIEPHLVLEALAYVPKSDDFTAEEQQKFLEKYLSYPKKWGTIAETLKGRDYQDCVRHYYYTKGEAQYKEKEKAFSRNKKGRRGGRGPQGRPKSNALMPLYDGTMDIEIAQIPVTDTGRPKRAVAPTFGQVADGEPATVATVPARRGAAAGIKGEAIGDVALEKPSRRGKGASVKEKGARKTRAPLLAAAPAPSLQKPETEIVKPNSKGPKMEVDQRMEEIEGANLLASLHNSQAVDPPLNKQGATEGWPSVTPPAINVPNQVPSPQTPQMSHEQQQQQPSRGAQTATSSYWSVPEQQDFQNLVNHFGTDWHAIANHMKSKTHTMVNNR